MKPKLFKDSVRDYVLIHLKDSFPKMVFQLRDAKWRKLKPGDIIEYSSPELPGVRVRVKVLWIVYHSTFRLLLRAFHPNSYGGGWSLTRVLSHLEWRFTRKKIHEHGVLGISVKFLKTFNAPPFVLLPDGE